LALKLDRARYKPLGRKPVWVDQRVEPAGIFFDAQPSSAQLRAQRPSRHLGMVRDRKNGLRMS
jgi:hypothetical protein